MHVPRHVVPHIQVRRIHKTSAVFHDECFAAKPLDVRQSFEQNRKAVFQTRPAGNSVTLEDEMLKVSANQMDYAAVTSLYSKSLHLLKTAIGKG